MEVAQNARVLLLLTADACRPAQIPVQTRLLLKTYIGVVLVVIIVHAPMKRIVVALCLLVPIMWSVARRVGVAAEDIVVTVMQNVIAVILAEKMTFAVSQIMTKIMALVIVTLNAIQMNVKVANAIAIQIQSALQDMSVIFKPVQIFVSPAMTILMIVRTR